MVPKDSLQSMAVPGSNTGKYTQPCSQSSPRKKLFSPSELKLPTTDTVLFYGHFSVLLPELFWSLLKSFTATVPWGTTIGEAEGGPTSAKARRRPKAGFGPGAPGTESELRLIYSPPGWARDAVPAPRMVSGVVTSAPGWRGARLLQLRMLRVTSAGLCGGGIQPSTAPGACGTAGGNSALIWKALVYSRENLTQ